MALKKEEILENGIKVTYHRIITLQLVINREVNIIVGSYISKSTRKNDILDDKLIKTEVYTVEYDKDFNIEKAYNYLKAQEEFKNAEDI